MNAIALDELLDLTGGECDGMSGAKWLGCEVGYISTAPYRFFAGMWEGIKEGLS